MATEIERKFLVTSPPDDLEDRPFREIEQGYVAVTDELEVRLRRKGDRFFQTIKSLGGLVRRELEVELTAEQFAALWPATEGRRLLKRRYEIADGDLTLEVDVYHGTLAGLVTAEVELASVAAAEAYAPPAWSGRDITDDRRYKNRELALRGRPSPA